MRLIDADKLIYEINSYCGDIFVSEIIDLIKNMPTVGEWIPCSERLPEVEDLHEISIEDCACYLIQRRFGVMDVAHYIKVYGEPYFEAHCMKFKDVIAWKPLPKPYRPERSNT